MRSMVEGAGVLPHPRFEPRAPSVSLRLPPPHEWGGIKEFSCATSP